MGFLVSPGVNVKEIDLTNVIPAVSTSIGATVGAFNWGPIDEIVTVGSEADLVAQFGKPATTNNIYEYFYDAANFLRYGNSLQVLRYSGDAGESALKNASGGDGVLVPNTAYYTANSSVVTNETNAGFFIAKYAGARGNGLKITVLTPNNFADTDTETQAALFTAAPGAGELHIVIEDTEGNFNDIAGSVLETFANVSLSSTAKKETGGSNYYVDVLYQSSAYIYAGHVLLANDTEYTQATETQVTLSNGADYSAVTKATVIADYAEFFGDGESNDANFFIGGALSSADSKTVIDTAAARKDVVAFTSVPVANVINQTNTATAVGNATSWASSSNADSSYGVLTGTAVYVYDKYNDTNRWVSPAGLIAGLCCYTDDVADAWFSPAGFNRGQLRGVSKLAYNPNNAQRDSLYKNKVNPIVSFPGQGIVLFGDKTAQSKPSAFDRINVRRLFITIEKAIATAAKFQLFEFNDEFTRAMFRNMVEPFLREVKGRRGITDFAVICDETNNTGNIIDTNQFVADIYIKPARSINFITLNFIATRTGIEFSEIIGE